MVERKSMRRALVLYLVLGFGFVFTVYNFLASTSVDPIIHPDKKTFHVALTTTDAPYSQWQCRIMYYWYKKVKDMHGSDMGKFTRILHSRSSDNLMDEIPTFVVDPLPGGLNRTILEEISPTWMNISLRMNDDQETDKAFGWVLEMYAYAVAFALHGVRHILRKELMLQSPWDLETGRNLSFITRMDAKGELTYGKIEEWRFDKRSYLSGPPCKNLSLPPNIPGWLMLHP